MLPPDRAASARLPERHLGYIDGLRAIAAIGVLVYHAWMNPDLGASHDTFSGRLFMMGAHGVDLFFVISGFCLAYPTLSRLRAGVRAPFDTTSFFARRIVRIVPPYYAAIVVFAVTYTALHLRSPGLSPLALVQQFLFLDRDQSYLASPFWTLAVELRWYVAFPALLGLYVRAPRIFGVLAVAAYACYYFTRFNPTDVGTLPAFMLGIWAADLQITQSRLRTYATAVGLPCAIASVAMMSGTQFYAVQPIGVIAACAFLVAAGSIGWLRRTLASKVFTFFGVASYSIYLVHWPVIEYVEAFHHAPPWLASLLALAAAMGFYAAFERPWLLARVRDPATAFVRARLARIATYLGAAPATAPTAFSTAPEPADRPAVATRV